MSRLIKRLVRKWRHWRSAHYDTPLAEPTPEEAQLIQGLRKEFVELAKNSESTVVDPDWAGNIRRLRELVEGDDPRNFLRWDVILKTMAVTYAPYVLTEYQDLRQRKNWVSRWSELMKEDRAGHPVPYWKDPLTSENLIHHAYHLARFEKSVSVDLSALRTIFEFGGGYGSMCRLFHRLGFRGRYVVYDLPEFSALQRYYLKEIPLPVGCLDLAAKSAEGIFCVSNLRDLDYVLKSADIRNSLFLATWSFSEIPVSLRNQLLEWISNFQSFLIAYQARFSDIDNVAFFREFQMALTHIAWSEHPIGHIRNDNRYLFGVRSISFSHGV